MRAHVSGTRDGLLDGHARVVRLQVFAVLLSRCGNGNVRARLRRKQHRHGSSDVFNQLADRKDVQDYVSMQARRVGARQKVRVETVCTWRHVEPSDGKLL